MGGGGGREELSVGGCVQWGSNVKQKRRGKGGDGKRV